MSDEQHNDECPGILPDEEVAKAIKRLWTWLRAVPASRMVGSLNMLFGLLAIVYGCNAIVGAIRFYDEIHNDNFLEVLEISMRATGAEDMAEERQEMDDEMETWTLQVLAIDILRLANATFLFLTGLLLWRGTRRARKLARIALWLIPAEILVSCIVYWPPVMTDWSAFVSGTYEWLLGRSWPVRVVVASIGWLWVIVYPLVALRLLRREADIEVHLQEAPPA
jgi:hypothetical protein